MNSRTDNNAIGDERNFVRIKEVGSKEKYGDKVLVKPGKEYEVYIYYANGANPKLNLPENGRSGVAVGVRLSAYFSPYIDANSEGIVSAIITGENTKPEGVWDSASIMSESPIKLSYKEGSAVIYNGGAASGEHLTEELFDDKGTLIGLDELDGVIYSGGGFVGHITYILRAEETVSEAEQSGLIKPATQKVSLPEKDHFQELLSQVSLEYAGMFKWSPKRKTYSINERPDSFVMNSIIDNPSIGDERGFVRIKERGSKEEYGFSEVIRTGKVYDLIIYFHNNAKAGSDNQCGNCKIKVKVPMFLLGSHKNRAVAEIYGENGELLAESGVDMSPEKDNDQFRIKYVADSARLLVKSRKDFASITENNIERMEFNLDLELQNDEEGFILLSFELDSCSFASSERFGWGPARKTFTMKVPATYPTFNSIIDSTVGDQRLFTNIARTGPDMVFKRNAIISPGEEYTVCIDYMNDAAGNYCTNDNQSGVAKDVRVSSKFSEYLKAGETGGVNVVIESSNADPQKIWCGAYIHAIEDVRISYKKGSGRIFNDRQTNKMVLPDSLGTTTGALIGASELDGVVPCDHEHHGKVIFVLSVEKAEFDE